MSNSSVSNEGYVCARFSLGVTSLATETLASIFTIGAHARLGNPETPYHATSFPLLVSHVCSRWRNVALSTSRLWSTILVYEAFALPVTANSDGEEVRSVCLAETTCLERIRTFLERSKSQPLTLYIDVRLPSWYYRPCDFNHPFTAEHMSSLLDLFLPHMGRWREVEIISDSWPPFGKFLERCSNYGTLDIRREARSLQRIALTRANAYIALETVQPSSEDLKEFFRTFYDAPSLRHVLLAGVHIDWTNHFLKNLTELSLMHQAWDVVPTPSELVNIINSSRNLEILSIHGWGVRQHEDNISEFEGHIRIKNIKRLSIGWVSVQHYMRLLSLFDWHMPNLETITLEDVANSLDPFSEQDSSCVIKYISTHLQESGSRYDPHCGATELALYGIQSSFDSLRCLLEALPRLRSITLHNVNNTLLHTIDPLHGRSEDGSLLCPELMRVVIRTVDGASTVELRQMVRARQLARNSISSSTHLISLEIVDLSKSDEEDALLVDDKYEDDDSDDFVPDDALFFDRLSDIYWNGDSSNENREDGPLGTPSPKNIPFGDTENVLRKDDVSFQPIRGNEAISVEHSGVVICTSPASPFTRHCDWPNSHEIGAAQNPQVQNSSRDQ